MIQTAQQSEFAPARGSTQPAGDAVPNFAVGEMVKPWSAIASQIWSGDSSSNDVASSKRLDFSIPKALSDSLGLSTATLDVQTKLENQGLLPRTRIGTAPAEGQRNGFVVQWGDGVLPAERERRSSRSTAEGSEEAPDNGGRNRGRTPQRNREVQPDRSTAPERKDEQDKTNRRRREDQPERSEKSGRTRQRDGLPEADRPAVKVSPDGELGKVYEMQLQNNTGRHKVDASVIIPKGYDPQKPTRMLVYNHGFRTDAQAALSYSQLPEQMRAADPQTILVVPEWQASPGSNSSARGRSDQQNFYRDMFNEIIKKTPELSGKTVDDIATIGIIAHSAGYNPTVAQLYKNGLQEKITSITVLDSMYNPTAYDGWINSNLRDLAAGRKHFQLIYTGHLARQSTGLEARVEQQLARAGLGTQSVYKDHGRGGSLVSPETIAQHGFVFKRSEFTNRGDGAHGAMTHVYLRQLLRAERGSA